jgi:ribosomal protein S18 acetylase RimI-like enzyme
MTDDLHLVDLLGDDLAVYLVHLEKSYAEDMSRLGGAPIEEARERARRSMLELFPDGQPAEGNQLWRAQDGDGRPVGVLWLARRDDGAGRPYAWIYDIEVEPDRRGQGWGRRLMVEAERISREWGLASLRLNVFGDNEVARNLYRSQGFREHAVVMGKDL